MEKFKKVSKLEFEEFIKNYPNELTEHTSHIITPPVKTFNDFTTGEKYPYSVVASISMGWLGDNGEYASEDNPEEFWTYAIHT